MAVNEKAPSARADSRHRASKPPPLAIPALLIRFLDWQSIPDFGDDQKCNKSAMAFLTFSLHNRINDISFFISFVHRKMT